MERVAAVAVGQDLLASLKINLFPQALQGLAGPGQPVTGEALVTEILPAGEDLGPSGIWGPFAERLFEFGLPLGFEIWFCFHGLSRSLPGFGYNSHY